MSGVTLHNWVEVALAREYADEFGDMLSDALDWPAELWTGFIDQLPTSAALLRVAFRHFFPVLSAHVGLDAATSHASPIVSRLLMLRLSHAQEKLAQLADMACAALSDDDDCLCEVADYCDDVPTGSAVRRVPVNVCR